MIKINRRTAIALIAGSFWDVPTFAQNASNSEPSRPWVGSAFPSLAKQFSKWQIKFEAGRPYAVPEKGVFAWQGRYRQGIARLVSIPTQEAQPTLTPVKSLARYRGARAARETGDLAVTPELITILQQPDVTNLINKDRSYAGAVNYDRDLEYVLVQNFDAALRVPGKRERIQSITWRFINNQPDQSGGMEVWGIFAHVERSLVPLYVVASKAYSDYSPDHYLFLVVGDLNGDGIDELITQVLEDEPEDARFAILERERGSPVILYDSR
jgi:hypothetical protein